MGFFSFFKEKTSPERKILELQDSVDQLGRIIKDIKNDIDKLEIKALESRKIYKKKLNQAFGDDEKDENIDSRTSVLLPER